MIGELKPYADYLHPHHDWLGPIPSHWGLLRAKHVFREVDERSATGKEELLSVSHLTGVTPRRLKNVTMFMAESNIGHKVCRPDDLVINTLWAWMGALGIARHAGIVSPAYGVYRPTCGSMLPAYAGMLLRTPLYAAEYQRRSTGVNSSRLRLYPEQFLRIPLVVPPPEEQAAIVRFLDWANGRLERTIWAKRKVIALLNEQKQAIVHRAVTLGTNLSAPLMPSGIPWLGDIPKTWRTTRLKHGITPIEQGWSPQCDAQPAADGEWGVLKVGCVNKDAFLPTQNKKLPASLQPVSSLAVRPGDILVSRANTKALVGLAALVESTPGKRILCDKLFRFQPQHGWFDAKFLVLALRSKPSRAQIEASTGGASDSMQNIGQSVVKNLWLAVPPLEEQVNICRYASTATQPITDAISRLEREIDVLREYRTRLIADVVTGQLDVREAAARLPDEASPDATKDDPDLTDEADTADEEEATP